MGLKLCLGPFTIALFLFNIYYSRKAGKSQGGHKNRRSWSLDVMFLITATHQNKPKNVFESLPKLGILGLSAKADQRKP